MSRLLHLSMWLDERGISGSNFASVLELIAEQSLTATDPIFQGAVVYDRDLSLVLRRSTLRTSSVSEIVAVLPKDLSPTMAVEVAATYDWVGYDDVRRTLERDKRRLVVKAFGPEYGWQGLEFKSFGPLRLDWHSTKSFGVPIELVIAAREGADDLLTMIPQLRQNYARCLDLARSLIRMLDPPHLILYSDVPVHPLMAHTIYHRDVNDFSQDVNQIICLHEAGGAYLAEVNPGDPAFVQPRRETRDYGYLRSKRSDEWTAEGVSRIELLAASPLQASQLSSEDVREVVLDSFTLNVESFGDGLMLSAKDAPFDYVEETYIRLFDKILEQ